MTQARYPWGHSVNDVVGAASTDVRWTGGYLLDILCSYFGLLADPSKDNGFRWVMDVLGVAAKLAWADSMLRRRVSTDVIRKWLEVLARVLVDCRLTPEAASKNGWTVVRCCHRKGEQGGSCFH